MTTQLTIRGVDERLRQALELEAQSRGISLNRAVLVLLRRAIGLGEAAGPPLVYADLDPLAGTWTDEEADAFDRRIAEQRAVDEDLWR